MCVLYDLQMILSSYGTCEAWKRDRHTNACGWEIIECESEQWEFMNIMGWMDHRRVIFRFPSEERDF